MRKQLAILIILLSSLRGFGQSPSAFKYQAVARNSSGSIIAGQLVSFRISILKNNPGGNPVYSERHADTTNSQGIVSLEIGWGTDITGSLDSIDWSSDTYFLKVEIDESGGSDYKYAGTSQLLSVPYALYSNKSGSTGQSSKNYYATGTIFISASDTAYKSIPGLDPEINVPSNSTVLISTTGTGYGTQWSAFASIKIALFIDGAVPENGGVQTLWIVTDDTKSAGGANWSINYPVNLSPGTHTIEVKAKSLSLTNETSITIDNGGYFDSSTLTITILKN